MNKKLEAQLAERDATIAALRTKDEARDAALAALQRQVQSLQEQMNSD